MTTSHKICIAVAIAVFTAIVYSPGMSGGFVFDDYPHILFNQAIAWQELSWNNLILAATSSAAGLFGRPVAILSFAINYYFDELNPLGFKLVNLGIHIVNSLLIFLLAQKIINSLSTRFPTPLLAIRSSWIASFAALLWAVHPLNLTAVLYVIQRMTSLSASFTLIALLMYLKLREGNLSKPRQWLCGIVLLTSSITAIYTKEIAFLLPVYALALELFVLDFQASSRVKSNAIKAIYMAGILVPVIWIMWRFIQDPGWLTRMHEFRPFTLTERLMTESRALWFYLQNIVTPDTLAMSLYHDDFLISKNWLTPPSTLFSLFGHISLITIAWLTRNRWPFLAFALAWFYGGHLLESTVIPLEPVFEHRNYLPMLGICMLMALCIFGLAERLRIARRWKIAVAGLMILPFAIATAVRADQWRDPVTFALSEAEKHPYSSRANFDAGRTLLVTIVNHPELKGEYETMAMDYFVKASNGRLQLLEPFMTAFQMSAQLNSKVPDDFYPRFIGRLKNGYIPVNFASIALGMRGMSEHPYRPLTNQQMQEIYEVALANPRLGGQNRAHMLISYAIFVSNEYKEYKKAEVLIEEAITLAPQYQDFKIILAHVALWKDEPERAEQLIKGVEEKNNYGRYTDAIGDAKHSLQLYRNQFKEQ